MTTEPKSYQFRDATSLTKWTRLSIYAQMAMACVAVVSGFLEHDVLVSLRDGLFPSPEAATEAAQASDARQGLVAIPQFLVILVSGFLILRWIHRANWNARARGALDLQFTPGWAIGYYFMPIYNLWKPYNAMQEIWKASAKPADWKNQPVPGLVGAWWSFYLLYGFLGNAAFRMASGATEVNALLEANMVSIASDVAALPLCIALLMLMKRLGQMQTPA